MNDAIVVVAGGWRQAKWLEQVTPACPLEVLRHTIQCPRFSEIFVDARHGRQTKTCRGETVSAGHW